MAKPIDISKLDKAEVLAALYNNSHPMGLGLLQFNSKEMTVKEARKLLETQVSFDYIYGRVMKIDLSGDTLDPWLYDRDNGEGAAKAAIEGLEAKLKKK